MTNALHPEHQGYDSGHCWYYRLGGKILTLTEIRKSVEGGTYAGYLAGDIEKIANKKEPKRSQDARALRTHIEDELARDARMYVEAGNRVRYRRRWLGPYQDEVRLFDEPFTAISLKHNHLYNGFANLRTLDNLTNQQMELF